MAYVKFQDGKPIGTDPGPTFSLDSNTNIQALRDMIALGLEGWNLTQLNGTGTDQQPQYIEYSKGNLRIRGTITWGSSGPENGSPTNILYEYSSNSGSNWDVIGTKNITYFTTKIIPDITWS